MRIRNLIFFGLHLLLGVVVSGNKEITYYFGIACIGAGVVDILVNSNRGNRAALWAGYFMGMEVFLRMTSTSFFWEIGKYGVITLLLTGLISDRVRREKPLPYVWYFLMLVPSILIVDFPDFEIGRQQISFNLSGPLSLAVASFYFYKRKLTSIELTNLLRVMVLPLTVMLTYIILTTPDIETIRFSTQSNYTASGFGPNQVSTMLGLGALVTGIAIFYRIRLTGFYLVDILIFTGFTLRGLFTFSRGGMVSAILALSLMVIFYFLFSSKVKGWLGYGLLFLVVVAGVSYVVWDYANEATNEMLKFRYLGINPVNNKQDEDITSRRWDILQSELDAFAQKPVLGIGPGMEKYDMSLKVKKANSHSELTRLMAEHGLFGIVSLGILLMVPIRYIRKLPSEAKPLAIAFFSLAILTMFHSAMRLAMPGFLYGLSLMLPIEPRRPLAAKIHHGHPN